MITTLAQEAAATASGGRLVAAALIGIAAVVAMFTLGGGAGMASRA